MHGSSLVYFYSILQIESQQSTENISVLEILMNMRDYRMGLIQTQEQLRFSYLAIVDGAKKYVPSLLKDSGFGESDVSIEGFIFVQL